MAGIINRVMGSLERGVYRLSTLDNRVLTSLDRAFERGFGRVDLYVPCPELGPMSGLNSMMVAGSGDMGGPIDIFSGEEGIFRAGDLVPGHSGKQYRVDSALNKGGMSEVYNVTDGANVHVLKVMAVDCPDEYKEEVQRRFIQEIRIMGEIRSLYVVKLIDWEPTKDPTKNDPLVGTNYYIMEKIIGKDLKTRVHELLLEKVGKWGRYLAAKRGETEISQETWDIAWDKAYDEVRTKGILGDNTLKIVLGIALHAMTGLMAFERAARAELKTEKVAHRDIKPENLFLVENDSGKIVRAVLGDFGVAKIAGSNLTRTKILIGTLGYAAPEIFTLGGKKADQRSDIFSIGATMYYALTGKEPIPSEANDFITNFTIDPGGMMAGIFDDKPDFCPDLLWQLVKRAMSAAPIQRPQTYRELADAIHDIYLKYKDIGSGK